MIKKSGKKILVDWLTFTVSAQEFFYEEEGSEDEAILGNDALVDRMYEFLGLTAVHTDAQIKGGLYGYRVGYYLGGIRVCMGGQDTVMVDMSGEGCRLYESLGGLDWPELIGKLQGLQWYHISRLDVACDTFGQLKMQNLLRYALEGRYVSQWKSSPRIVQGREETIDFGSVKSRIMLRIYNKTLERQCKSDVPEQEIPADWVRCELQLRNKAVESFVREWRSCGDISAVYFGIMSGHLRFVRRKPEQETNYTRMETVCWWRDFLDNAQPIKMAYRGGLEYNFDTLGKYVFQQAGSSIKAWLEITGGDLAMLRDGVSSRSYNERQRGLLQELKKLEEARKNVV